MNRPGRRLAGPLGRLPVCPDCRERIACRAGRLRCAGGHDYAINSLGIPLMDPSALPATGEQEAQQEEDAAAYAGMRAFAGEALGRGESEGLYRTVNDLLQRVLAGKRPRLLLDLGCGPGRTLVDAATAFPGAAVIGLDRSVGALTMAHAVARLRGAAVEVDLRRWGFGLRVIPARNLANVFLVQASTERLPFLEAGNAQGFDAVTCINLIDRVEHPETLLSEIARILAPGGSLLLTSPLNWREGGQEQWNEIADVDALGRFVSNAGFLIETAFDGLVYREVLDARGSLTDWRVAVLVARRLP